MYQIAKNKLNDLYQAISEKEDLFLPVSKGGQTNYGLWTNEAVADIDTLKTVKSGKDCFFPQSEVLYKSRHEDGKISIDPAELQNKPFVVFGMRACDVRAVKVLDNVFLTRSGGQLLRGQKRAWNHRIPGLSRAGGDLLL